MRRIYLYGASGHGRVVADVARACGYDEIVFLDDASETRFSPDLPRADIVVSIGDCAVREKIQTRVEESGFRLATLIHPSATISPSASIGAGSVVMPRAVINADAKVGRGVIINTGAIVEHDCAVGDFTHVCPACAIAGGTKIGKRVWFGIGSHAIQGVSVADDVFIGAGSTITSDIPACRLAYGTPCKVVK